MNRCWDDQIAELEPESVDLALFVDVYREFWFPYEVMLGISEALIARWRA